MNETQNNQATPDTIDELLDDLIRSTIRMAKCSVQSEILEVCQSIDLLVRLRKDTGRNVLHPRVSSMPSKPTGN